MGEKKREDLIGDESKEQGGVGGEQSSSTDELNAEQSEMGHAPQATQEGSGGCGWLFIAIGALLAVYVGTQVTTTFGTRFIDGSRISDGEYFMLWAGAVGLALFGVYCLTKRV